MPDSFQGRLEAGVRNLLINCAKCQPGQSVLIVCEMEGTDYYDPDLGKAVQFYGAAFGLRTEIYRVPLNRDVCDPCDKLTAKIGAADCTVFLARLGDQIRFRPKAASTTQIISYALDRDMLASPFGTIDYRAFDALKGLINNAISQAKDVHVTCPAGTDFRGKSSAITAKGGDTSLMRFPVSVFAPVPAAQFQGRIAQNGFLTGTGSHYYSPWACELKETLFINFEGAHITGFDGSAADVATATAHYEFVGQKYGIDTFFVHSWHAGIHPACAFDQPAGRNFERWSGGAFGNPRILHFHTCGAYPPGEISLNVLDPTVRLDGVAVWENGVLHPERIAGGAALLDRFPDMTAALRDPVQRVGQSENGQLMYA